MEADRPEASSERTSMNLADIAGSQFASWARQLIMTLITNLRALGAQADFDLPRIAVIGNQSAGKSSLVEAISGINVPRAHGTCTRCPMECRMTNNDHPWQCQVLLRRTDETGQTTETKFGSLLHDKTELSEMLRRAQMAILNPGLSSKYFENFDTTLLATGQKPPGSPKQLAFSSDVVCLDLAGPELPDLSFIDLPGIISTVDKSEDKSDIDAVKKMIQDHIQGNTLILLTITMRDDMNNQGAAHLAQLADPTGARTIGVLTKPDLIQEGEEDGWLRILAGLSGHELKHGYFITKHPSPKEIEERIGHDEAREREAKFFETTPPWSYKTELRSRMGTPNLTRKLSTLLGALISKSIPDLQKEAQESLDAVEKSLSRLPPPPSDNLTVELLRMVNDLFGDVQALIRGTEGSERLLQKCRPAHQRLKFSILSTAPNFRPFKSEKDDPKTAKCAIDKDDIDLRSSTLQKPMYLEAVKSHIESSLTRQLPFNVPFSAKVDLIKRCFEDWEAHCMECFNAIHDATQLELRTLAQDHFGQFTGSTLLADVRTLCDDLVEKHRARTLDLIKFQLELEDVPFTLNDHYFSACREKYLALYKDARKPSATNGDRASVQEALAALARIGINVTQDDLAKLRKEDQYEEELIVMAETSAYFRVAYKRVIDNIPGVIDLGFLRAIVKDLYDTLISGLSLAGDHTAEQAARYLAEDHQIKAERMHLTQKRGRLEAALKELRKFQNLVDPLHAFTVPIKEPRSSRHLGLIDDNDIDTPPASPVTKSPKQMPQPSGAAFEGSVVHSVDEQTSFIVPRMEVTERDKALFSSPATEIASPFSTRPQLYAYDGMALVKTGSYYPHYSPWREKDPVNFSTMLVYQSISCAPAYRTSSFEELRAQEYEQGRKTSIATTPFSLFRSQDTAQFATAQHLEPSPPAKQPNSESSSDDDDDVDDSPHLQVAPLPVTQPSRRKRKNHRNNRH